MDAEPTGMCGVCGKPAQIHLTDNHNGVKTHHSFCMEHAPAEMRDATPFGPHRTPTEEVAFLRKQLDLVEARLEDPTQRAELKAEIEKLVADIEAGRRRMGDAE